MSLADIDAVLTRLDDALDDMRQEESRAGYFAAMYRKVTLAVREAVVAGRFADGARMARLDRVFAERYLDAWEQWRTGAQPTASWRAAFEASERWRPIIVQHLLVGMNAHINLDLGIAAAVVAPGSDLSGLRGDFDTINDILGELVDGFMGDVEEVSPWIGFLDRIGGRTDQALVRFSIELARRQAWSMAEQLAAKNQADWGSLIAARDASTARLTKTILTPGRFLPAGLLLIRLRESNDVPRVIDLLGR